MRRDDAFLLDILDAARLALQYVSGTTLQDFLVDVKSQDAVIRRFIVIDIDLPILWDTATRDLPKLIAKLEEIGVPGS